MNMEDLTHKVLEALAKAQSNALERKNPIVDVDHVLLALLEDNEGLYPRILQALNLKSDDFVRLVKESITSKATVSDIEPDKLGIGYDLNQWLLKANQE